MSIEGKLKDIKAASQQLGFAKAKVRDHTLRTLAQKIEHHQEAILDANRKDLERLPDDYSKALRDRLTLTESRLSQMCESLLEVAKLPSPLMKVISKRVLKNKLILRQVTSPIGVILMIFESRPNVITEAFSMAFKTGNGFIMKGGKETLHTARLLYDLINESIRENDLDPSVFWGLDSDDRELVQRLMRENKFIDLVIPRGGEKLIEYVVSHSRIPIIKNDRGLVHVFIDKSAQLKMAVDIVDNSKTHRPSVCNAMETLLVHKDIAQKFLPAIYARLVAKNVDLYCCPRSFEILSQNKKLLNKGGNLHPAAEGQFDQEYLDLKMSCKVVDNLNAAMEHIAQHGSKHTEVIVTENRSHARIFQKSVDASCVYWNSSSRFTDGFEFGLGGEIGVSTQKLHVRGPIGLNALTSIRWVIDGEGQIRK